MDLQVSAKLLYNRVGYLSNVNCADNFLEDGGPNSGRSWQDAVRRSLDHGNPG